ncbi:MAG: sigma-70 family RNA polymerase sigma factor [Deltaproteobacteria bacterium]|nr:sigma-70 family RNA polymerase sigma factor [Deltaproteobacteria bacterium]
MKKQTALPVHNDKLETLVEENFDYLYRYAYRYFRSSDLAEDLVQETFLAATEAYDRFEGKSSPRTWLTSILRHKIIDRLRTKHREEPVDFDALERESLGTMFNEVEHWQRDTAPVAWRSSPDGALAQKQFFKALDGCLGKLPSKMRQLFLLRELEGIERDQICSQLEISASNAAVLLHRARLSLQQCLQATWFLRGATEGKS